MKMTRKLQREWLKGQARLLRGLSVGALALTLSFASLTPVWASNISATDLTHGGTITKITNGSGDIYNITEQQHKGTLGYNAFKDFTVTQGDIVNMHLANDTTKLLNLVTEQISISGMVNSYQNSKIGGNVYFISPKGIMVGATGVINVGSLVMGTNYKNAYNEFFYGKTTTDYAGDGTVAIGGTINALGDINLQGQKVIVDPTAKLNSSASFKNPNYNKEWTPANYANGLVNMNNVDSANRVAVDKVGKIYLYGSKSVTYQGRSSTSGGDFDIKSEETISITGKDAANKALIDTRANSTTAGASGNIAINAIRDNNGTTSVTIKDAVLNADKRSNEAGYTAGNVDINAITATQAYTYAVLTTEAKVNIEDSSLVGDNVHVSAMATNTGNFGADDSGLTDEQKEQNISDYATNNQDSIVKKIKDYGGNARTILAFADVTAKSTVDITNSELHAVGGTKGDKVVDGKLVAAEHGMLTINAQSDTGMQTKNIGLVGIGVNVAITEADSHVNVKNSKLTAAKDLSIKALGNNDINIYYMDLSLVDDYLRTSINFSMGELTNDVGVTVDDKSVLTAAHDLNISSEAYRSLAISASGSGDSSCVGLAVGLGLVDSKAITDVQGKLYVGNDANITAKSAIKYDEASGQYSSDKLVIASSSGDTYLKSAITPIKEPIVSGVKTVGGKILDWISEKLHLESSEDATPEEPSSPPGSKWGVNAATAVLLADTRAEAKVDATIRGVTGGVGDDNKAMGGSLKVNAETISRISMNVQAFQNKLTDGHGNELNSKDTGISVAVNYGQEDNDAIATLGGDIKVAGDVQVKAENLAPWQTAFTDTTAMGLVNDALNVLLDPNLGVANLVDSWAQGTATTEKVGVAGSVGVIEYSNNADAHINANTKLSVGKELDVKALNDITTVNFSGNVKSPLSGTPISAIWLKDKYKLGNMWGNEGEGTAIGGAALSVHQDNTAKAYIADSAQVENTGALQGKVSAAKINVEARNEAMNLAMAASGGKSDSVAVNGTVLVNRFDNSTEAYIGRTEVELTNNNNVKDTGKVNVEAVDKSLDISLGGAVGVTEGSTGIGATIAYNHIDRDTSAYILGNIKNAADITVEAKNTGTIVAVGVAGSIAMPKTEADDAVQAVDAAGGGRDAINVDEQTVNELLNVGETQEVTADTGANTAQEVNDSAREANVADAQNSFAIAASVAVNRILDTAHAYVGKSDADASKAYAPTISGQTLNVHGINDSEIINVTGAVSLNLEGLENNNAIGGSFTYNSMTSENTAAVENAELVLIGNPDAKKDEALTVHADNEEEIVNVALSGGVATKGNAWTGQVSINWVDNTTKAYVQDSKVKAKEAVLIKAEDEAEIESFTGSVSVSGKNSMAALGVAVGVNLVDAHAEAFAKDTIFDLDRALTIQALENSDFTSIVAAGAVAVDNKSWSISGSANGNDIDSSAKAYLENSMSKLGYNSAGAVKVEAQNLSNVTLGTGNVSVGGSSLGAAVGVLVADASAESYVKTDPLTLEAASLEILATNVYNGSSEEGAEDDTRAKNVAVGGGVGFGDSGVAAQGSVTVNNLKQTTSAHLEEGKYDLSGKLDVLATSRAYMFGMAGGVAVGTGTGAGAAVDTQLVDVDTSAYINNGVVVKRAGDITVKADSVEKITSLALQAAVGGEFAGAGAANAHDVDIDTLAWIGRDDEQNPGRQVVLSDQDSDVPVGNINVLASDDATLKINAAQGSFAGNLAGGLSIGVAVVDKNVKAMAENLYAYSKGLNIDAQNLGYVLTTANGVAGSGTGALAGSAAETIASYTTDAHLGPHATVDASNWDEYGNLVGGSARINANSSFKHVGEAAGLAGSGTVAIGLSNDATYLTQDTRAYVGKEAWLSADKGIAVHAEHTTDITNAVVAGGFAGNVAVNGGVGVNKLSETTLAFVDEGARVKLNGTTDASGKAAVIDISAMDTTTISSGNGGAAVGVTTAGAGAAVSVNSINKNTQAYVGKGAKISADRSAHTANNKLNITADNNEDIYGLVLQGSGGLYAGVAGAVNVNDLSITTKAFTDTGVQVAAGGMEVQATHEVKRLTGTVVGFSAGVGAIGAAVDVGTIASQTNAYVGDSNTLTLKGGLGILATEGLGTKDQHVLSNTVNGGVGLGSIEGSFSIYNVQSSMTDEDKELLNNKNGNFAAWVKEQSEQSNAASALSKYDNSVAASVNEKLSAGKTSDIGSTVGSSGVAAKIGSNTSIEAASGDISVKSKQNLYLDVYSGSGTASVLAGVGMSISKLNSTTTTLSSIGNGTAISATAGKLDVDSDVYHEHKSTVNGAGISAIASGQALDTAWTDKSTAKAILGDLKDVAAKNMNINAVINRVYDGRAYGGTAALLGAISGAGIHATIGGGATAGIGNQSGSKVNSGSFEISEAINITAEESSELKGEAVVPSAGIFSGAGSGVYLTSDSDATTYVGNNETLKAKNITLSAKAAPKADAAAHGYSVAGFGVGAAVARIEQKDDAIVHVGEGAQLQATNEANIAANSNQPTKGYNAYALATAGSAGAINAAASSTIIELEQKTKVNIGANAAISGAKINIEAVHKDSTNLLNSAAAGGAFSGGGLHTTIRVNSDSAVNVGKLAQLKAEHALDITADNLSEKPWRNSSDNDYGVNDQNGVSAGVGLVNGNGIDNLQDITHTTTVDIGEQAQLAVDKVQLTEQEQQQGTSIIDKNALNINAHSKVVSKSYNTLATGTLAGAAVISSDNLVTANTKVNLGKDTLLTVGKVDLAKSSFEEGYTNLGASKNIDVGGGSIGIGAYNDADLYNATNVHIWGVAGGAGSNTDIRYTSNTEVNTAAHLETANGDIRLAAGEDSRGNQQHITARADGYIVNATAVPVSGIPKPTVIINNQANVNIEPFTTTSTMADIASDRNVYLTASAGDLNLVADGNIKDWVHGLVDGLCFVDTDAGKVVKSLEGNVQVNGSVETGIHRDRWLSIDGVNDNGIWKTSVAHSIGVGYTIDGGSQASTDMLQRLLELKKMKANYQNDPAASAAYDAEIQFMEAKLVAAGYGEYREGVFIAYTNDISNLQTHTITVDTIESRLGNISVQADNLYGKGKLNAPDNAIVKITNNSPNNIVVNDITVNSATNVSNLVDGEVTQSIVKADDGAKITFNGVVLFKQEDIAKKNKDSSKSVAFTKLNSHNLGTPTNSAVIVENTFKPNDYLDGNNHAYYAAPTLKVGKNATIYNPYGSVSITSAQGDVYSDGSIYADTVKVDVKNGDFIQGYSNRLANVGGLPENEVNGPGSAGIKANGNIYIAARYVNINAPIESGVSYYLARLDYDLYFHYRDASGKAHDVTLEDINKWTPQEKASRYVYVGNAERQVIDYIHYDAVKGALVVDDLELRGGNVTIVGTIMNTNALGNGSIKALDGYGTLRIENFSKLPLLLGNISCGDNTEGIIKLVDLDVNTGEVCRTTTYTRNNGVVNCSTVYGDGSVRNSTTNGNTTYNPADNLWYYWLTGKDQSTVYQYKYSGSDFNIFGKWGSIKDEALASTNIQSTTVLADYTIPSATYVGSSLQSGMKLGSNGVYTSTKTYINDVSEPYDKNTVTWRNWYELWTVQHYDNYFKIKEGSTTITTHAIKANNPISISFTGSESNGSATFYSNGNLIVDGVVNNKLGNTTLSAMGNISQGSMGFVNTNNLKVTSYQNSIGSANSFLQTSAKNIAVDARYGNVYLQSTNLDTTGITSMIGSDTISLKTAGSMVMHENGDYRFTAKNINLESEYGSIGSTDKPLQIAMKGEGSLTAQARGDIGISNTSENLYVNSVISEQGNVLLVTQGSLIDVNKTDLVDETTAAKLARFARSQILAGEAGTAEKQKGMLCAKVDNKYNRYQTLSQNVQEGKFVLSDSEKATLTELGRDAAAYAAACQSEYDALVAAGVDKWTAEGVAQYKESINNSTDSIYANASVTKEQLAGDTYLTQAEKAEVLVGSCYTDRDLLLVIGNNSDKNVTDTNYLIKDVPNIQGKNVTLQAGGSIGHQDVLSGIDLNKDISLWTEDELLALGAAEAKDITITDGKATISLVKPIVVEADKVTATAGKDMYLATEGSFTDSSFTSTNGGDMRLKAADSLTNIQLKGATGYLVEAAKGSISGIEFAEEEQRSSTPITARAMQDITLQKEELHVQNVYSEQGKVSLSGSRTITGGTVRAGGGIELLGRNITLDALDSQQNVRMEAENVRVLGLSAGQDVFGKVDKYIQIYDIKAGNDVQLFNLKGRQIRLGDIEAGGKVGVTLNDNASGSSDSLTIESIVAQDTINIYGSQDVTVGSAKTNKDLRLYTNKGFVKLGDAWASQFYIEPAELDRYSVGSYNGVKNYKFIYHQGAYEGNEKGGFGELTGAGYEWYPEFRAATNTAPYGSQTMPSIDVVVAEEGQLTSGTQSTGVGASPTLDSSELQRAGVGGSQVAGGSAGMDSERLAAILANPPQEEQNAEGRRQEDTEIVIQ